MNYKLNYNNQEWNQRRQFYISECNNLYIPREAAIPELKMLISHTNNLLTQAYLDKASIYELYDREYLLLRNMEEECWCTIEWNKIGSKLIKEEKKGYIINYIKTTTKDEYGTDLYSRVSILSSRVKFIESVVYNLKDKAGALLNLLSLMKIENEITKIGSMN